MAASQPIENQQRSYKVFEKKHYMECTTKQKAQCGFNIFAIHAVILLVRDAAAIIHHAIQHQHGMAAALLEPGGGFDMLEIGRAQIKVPAIIAWARPPARERPV